MLRALALLVFAALVAALFLMPAPSASTLAVAQAGKVLNEPVLDWNPAAAEGQDPAVLPTPDATAPAGAPTLMDQLLASSAVEELPPAEEGGRPPAPLDPRR